MASVSVTGPWPQYRSELAPSDVAGTRVNTARLLCAALHGVAARIAGPGGVAAPSVGLTMPLAVLWSRTHKFDAADPGWADRDRFVLSAASATPLLYALLHLSGHAGMEQPTLDHCGELDAVAARVAVFGQHPGIEASAAPGGQAIAMGVGMALAERVLASRFGKSLVDHRVWLVADAAELTAGVTQEAASLAVQLRLDRLVLLADGSAADAEDARARFAAIGWAVKTVAADNPELVEHGLSFALRSRKPTLLWCVAGAAHAPARGVTANAMEAWRRVGARGAVARRAWLKRLARHPQRAEFDRVMSGRLPEALHEVFAAVRREARGGRAPQAPAETCCDIIGRLVACVPELVCGRVDACGLGALGDIRPAGDQPHPYAGHHVACHNRPHGMAACLNGVALHAGTLPFGASALIDVVEQMPALRTAALLRRRVVHLAFDPGFEAPGVAWRPAELLAWLRGIAHLQLFRPGCALETAECLELAIRRADGPSLLVLSRTRVPALRDDCGENRCVCGGYVLAEATGQRDATIIATGPGLAVAIEARTVLAADGIAAAVVSLPCWSLFAAQSDTFQAEVLGDAPRFALEAGGRMGWDRWLNAGAFMGCDDSDDAGPPDAVRARNGLTAELVALAVRRRLER